MSSVLRSAFVIARRDFSATVLSKTFLFFLLGPLFPLLFGGIFGSIGASVANSRERPVVAVVASPADFARLSAARDRVAAAMPEKGPVTLARFNPEPDRAAQEKRLLATDDPPVQAVLTDPLGAPHLIGAIQPDGQTARQLRLMIGTADLPPTSPQPQLVVTAVEKTSGSLSKDRSVTGQIGQVILFFLTLLLSTMLLSQVVEEKSNKIIEVIAAAVPIDAMFIGTLFAMLAASVIGIMLWTATGAALLASIKPGSLATLPVPAVGWPIFMALVIVYFAMNYLLFGAVFLTIGAQASTVREVQIMSMPVTFGQMLIFGFAAAAAAAPNSGVAWAATVFPLSSPLVMIARAAEEPAIWPHLAAIVWQMLWVAVILKIGASLFRKTVMKSGPRRKGWLKFGRA
jgi:ABC-2 type transport system permease protein